MLEIVHVSSIVPVPHGYQARLQNACWAMYMSALPTPGQRYDDQDVN